MSEQLATQAKMKQGVQFVPAAGERVSTTATGKQILQTAVSGVDDPLAAKIAAATHWRKQYPDYFAQLTAVSHHSAANAQQVAQQGLAAAHQAFTLNNAPLATALSPTPHTPFHTVHIVGDCWGDAPQLMIPYQAEPLAGQALLQQLALWETRGIVEPGHADSVRKVTEMPALARKSGRWFVLLGAGAELGPFETLLGLGATVVAIDVPNPAIWQRLIKTARQSAGELIFPIREPAAEKTDAQLAQLAGTDLLTEPLEVAAWLATLERPLSVGCYAYLDGSDFVRVAIAMDTIVAKLLDTRPETAVAFLLTPTDAYAVPEEVIEGWEVAYQRSPLLRGMGNLTGQRLFAPNLRGSVGKNSQYGLVDSIVPQQGPNYILAKRIQQWRAINAKANGHLVSCNVAPASFTSSVLSNKLFATGYRGAQSFGLEIFQPATANGLMAAQLVADLCGETAVSNAPLHELFMHTANHGGMWRTPFQVRTALVAGVLIGLVSGGYG